VIVARAALEWTAIAAVVGPVAFVLVTVASAGRTLLLVFRMKRHPEPWSLTARTRARRSMGTLKVRFSRGRFRRSHGPSEPLVCAFDEGTFLVLDLWWRARVLRRESEPGFRAERGVVLATLTEPTSGLCIRNFPSAIGDLAADLRESGWRVTGDGVRKVAELGALPGWAPPPSG
jgi:hypothetical protein